MPATTIAPDGPCATTSSMAWSATAGLVGGSELNMGLSVQRCRAQLVGLARRDRRAAIAPGGADVGDDGGDLVVGEEAGEGRHAVGHRIALGARRIAAIEHHADRIDRRLHLDRLVVGERRPVRRLALALRTVTARAVLVVDGLAEADQKAALAGRQRRACGRRRGGAPDALCG